MVREAIAILEQRHQRYYDCARKAANARSEGEQRDPEGDEDETLVLWANRELQLLVAPLFLMETKTPKERTVLDDYRREHLMWNLYGVLPPGSLLPKTNSRKHLSDVLVTSTLSQDEADRLADMLRVADSWEVAASSMVWTISFHHKDLRDVYDGARFRYGKGNNQIVLKATDSFTTAIPRQGMDAAARELCYSIYLMEQPSLTHKEVMEIGQQSAEMEVLDVTEVKSLSTQFQPHRWKITFRQLDCPAPLFSIRRLQITRGSVSTQIYVQHPRVTSKYFPCVKCLSIDHDTQKCTNVHFEAGLASHSREIQLDPGESKVKLTDLSTKSELYRQMKEMRQRLAPQLQKRLNEEREAAKREAAAGVLREAAVAAKTLERAERQVAAAAALERKRQGKEANSRLLAHYKQLEQQSTLLDATASVQSEPTTDGMKQTTEQEQTKASQKNEPAPSVGSADEKAAMNSVPRSQATKASQPGIKAKTTPKSKEISRKTTEAEPSTKSVPTKEAAVVSGRSDAQQATSNGSNVTRTITNSTLATTSAATIENGSTGGGTKLSVTPVTNVETAEAVKHGENEPRGRRRDERRGSIKQLTTAHEKHKTNNEQQKTARQMSYSPRRRAAPASYQSVDAPMVESERSEEAKSESQEPPAWTIKGWTKEEIVAINAGTSTQPSQVKTASAQGDLKATVDGASLRDPSATGPEGKIKVPKAARLLILTSQSQTETDAAQQDYDDAAEMEVEMEDEQGTVDKGESSADALTLLFPTP